MSRLKEAESTMRQNILDFVTYCEALIKIRDEKLFRENHETFDDYMASHFGDQLEIASESLKFYEEHLSK